MSDPTLLSHEGSTYDIEGKDNSGNTVIFQRRQAVVVFNGNVVEKQIKGVVASYLRYDVRGNVIGIYNDEAMTTPIVTYGYDESGNRISMTNANGSTYYVNDALGNNIATYTGTTGTTFSQVPVYGSERLGMFTVSGGGYAYEMRDNVGSVKVVINRNRTSSGVLDVMQYNDYYPFGSIARQGGNGYRYEYQGAYAEKDPATGFNNFDLRLYDSKIGRWLSVDPKGQFWSPYNGMGNNPVTGSDPTGGECDECPKNQKIGETYSSGNTTYINTERGWSVLQDPVHVWGIKTYGSGSYSWDKGFAGFTAGFNAFVPGASLEGNITGFTGEHEYEVKKRSASMKAKWTFLQGSLKTKISPNGGGLQYEDELVGNVLVADAELKGAAFTDKKIVELKAHVGAAVFKIGRTHTFTLGKFKIITSVHHTYLSAHIGGGGAIDYDKSTKKVHLRSNFDAGFEEGVEYETEVEFPLGDILDSIF
ncbi:RHS repeat-associated core domain-containing protein [Mucilaginibacter sp. JRF]|uniref:RHS repeat-associated core domain-containing protein n=1 Tax=Mucilaginibacter sp. JRF TaxID=2780088 RepID=UPI00187F5A0A|nr:RHS repeat-associated core domain-containing protein [Mucilaginibacter sp. JRF]